MPVCPNSWIREDNAGSQVGFSPSVETLRCDPAGSGQCGCSDGRMDLSEEHDAKEKGGEGRRATSKAPSFSYRR